MSVRRLVSFIIFSFIVSFINLTFWPTPPATISQGVALVLALVFGGAAGLAAEKAYTRIRPSASTPIGRGVIAALLVAAIVLVAYAFGALVFQAVAR